MGLKTFETTSKFKLRISNMGEQMNLNVFKKFVALNTYGTATMQHLPETIMGPWTALSYLLVLWNYPLNSVSNHCVR